MGRRTNNKLTYNNESCITKKISEILNDHPQYMHDDVFDVYSFANDCNDLLVKEIPLKENVSGYIEMHDGTFTIAINSLHSPLRKRFTLAHELGHYFLHKDKIDGIHQDTVLFRDSNEDKLGIEYAANDFASELLLPTATFVQAIKNGYNTPKKLSDHFKVSEKAALYKAFRLNLIKDFPF